MSERFIRALQFGVAALLLFAALASPLAAQEASEDPSGKWCIFESKPLDVYYPAERRVYLEGINIVKLSRQAFDSVHHEGAFKGKVVVIVYDRDTLNADPKGDLVPGYTSVIETNDKRLPEKIFRVTLTIWGVNEEVLRHELLHAMLLSNGIVPPRWLNEGLAYYHQRPDGYIERWDTLLGEHGTLPLSELPYNTEVAEDPLLENKRQACGWAIVYYLRKIEGKSFKEVLQLAKERKLPEPQDAFQALRDYQELVRKEEERSKAALKTAARKLILVHDAEKEQQHDEEK